MAYHDSRRTACLRLCGEVRLSAQALSDRSRREGWRQVGRDMYAGDGPHLVRTRLVDALSRPFDMTGARVAPLHSALIWLAV